MTVNGTPIGGGASGGVNTAAPKVNPQMVTSLRDALAKAEAGIITDFIGIAVGPNDLSWQAINVPNQERMMAMIGEINVIATALQNIIVNARAQAVQAQMAKHPRVLRPGMGERFDG